MRTTKFSILLLIILIIVTSCTSIEPSTYPTIAEINKLLESNIELFTSAAEILRSHKDFFDAVYEQTDQWRITSFDQEWIPSFFSDKEIELIHSVLLLEEPVQIKYVGFTVPMSARKWETRAPAIQFSYKLQDENGAVSLYELYYVRADDTGTESEKREAVETELNYLQRNALVVTLDVNGWYGIN